MEDLVARAWHESWPSVIRGIEMEAGRCRGRDIDIRPTVWEPFDRTLIHHIHRFLMARVRVDVRVMFRCDHHRDATAVAVSVSFERRNFGFSWIYPSLLDMLRSDGVIRDMAQMTQVQTTPRSRDYDSSFRNYRDLDDDRRPLDPHLMAALYSQMPSSSSLENRNEIPRSKFVASSLEKSDPKKTAVEKLVEIVRAVGEALTLRLASALSLRGFVDWGLGSSGVKPGRTLFPSGVCAAHGRVSPIYSSDASGAHVRMCPTCRDRRDQVAQSVEWLLSILTGVGEALTLRMASSLSLRGYVEWSSGQPTTPTAGRVRKAILCSIGLYGVCPRHGLVTSDTFEGERVCGKCSRCREAVRILASITRTVLDACAKRARDAIDWLTSTTLLCGHILWESLSDWHRRCLMLESEGATETLSDWERRRTMFSPGPRQSEGTVEPAVEEGLRFALLEID